MQRRQCIGIVAAVIWLASVSFAPALAQEWPTKSIRVIVPFTAGSAVDLVARTCRFL